MQKIPFFLELVFNGLFLTLYAFEQTEGLSLDFLPLVITGPIARGLAYSAPFFVFLSIAGFYLKSSSLEDFFRKYVFSLIVFVPMLMTFGDVQFTFWLAAVHLFSSVLSIYEVRPDRESVEFEAESYDIGLSEKIRLAPAQIVILSFGGLIMVGTLLLTLPISSVEGKSIALVDAFFIATSATCVTGLSPISLVDNFSFVGQAIVLILFQVGGLGYMTLHSSMMILLGKSLAMKNQVMMQDILDVNSTTDLLAMIGDIIKYTLVIEFFGALILTIAFSFEGYEFGQAIYYGIFHAISAFCNAGFALFNNSLEGFSHNPFIVYTVALMIFMGGLGFVVIKELELVVRRKKKLVNLSIHSKVACVTTLTLFVLVAVYIFFSEYLYSFKDMSLAQQIQTAIFHSVTTRTAGFNSMGMSLFQPHTLYLFILVMFIGANPGSTGGGIKTTTFAILFQSVRATLKGKDRVEFFDRTIPSALVVRSIAIIVIALMLCSFFILALMWVEPEHSFLGLFFEAVSAFSTVGLSLGVTPYLGMAGKLIIISMMFVGRIGPLTMALALGQKNVREGQYKYPKGRVMIG